MTSRYHGLRLVFLCSADSYRGSAVSFQHIALGLAERSAVVRLITGHEALTVPLREAGVDVVQHDLSRTNLRTALKLRAELKAFGADVLVVDRPRDLRLGMLATVGTRVALVNRYNSHAPRPPRDLLTRLAYRFGVRDTIFLTKGMAQRILQAAPWMRRANHRVIPEGISLEEFRPDPQGAAEFRARHGLGDAPFVLTVGALTKEKRTAMIIDAVAMMPDRPTLVLCGEGPLQEKLERQAEFFGVQVKFLGRLPRAEMRGAYSAATVVAHACAVETFGLSVLEAMACGAAVVGVHSGGLIEVVGETGEAGLLVAYDDAPAMGQAIARVVHDPELARALGEGARVRAASRFALERMTAGYELAVLGAWLLMTYY
jgi:glycosyltransferase involved in cell wall biosynthesis